MLLSAVGLGTLVRKSKGALRLSSENPGLGRLCAGIEGRGGRSGEHSKLIVTNYDRGPHEGQYVEDYTFDHRRLWYMCQATSTAAHVRVVMCRLARRALQ